MFHNILNKLTFESSFKLYGSRIVVGTKVRSEGTKKKLLVILR